VTQLSFSVRLSYLALHFTSQVYNRIGIAHHQSIFVPCVIGGLEAGDAVLHLHDFGAMSLDFGAMLLGAGHAGA
jgi:hypothetical protein